MNMEAIMKKLVFLTCSIVVPLVVVFFPLAANSETFFTGGGIIKEAYFLSTPCIIIDKQTEWTEIVGEGWATIAGPDKERILHLSKTMVVPHVKTDLLGDGHAAERILAATKAYLNE